MDTIQLALADLPYARALQDLLLRNGGSRVQCVDSPDADLAGVLVLDSEHLDLLATHVVKPERVVLIARNEPRSLAQAWEAGVTSVVWDKDPLSTAVLAIMAARLRISKPPAVPLAGRDFRNPDKPKVVS
ncbi:MAG: hypothetical protein ABI693_08095 [Bryobacteraceae bacterium]